MSQTYTTRSNGIPEYYTTQTANSRAFNIQKGHLNKYRLRPAILNEHAESSRLVQDTITSSNIVGQIFKASQDNINGILLTLESAAAYRLFSFEGYADDAAVQAAWIASNGSYLATLSTTIAKVGSQSMRLPMGAVVGDECVRTLAPADYTNYTFSLSFYQDISYSLAGMSFFIGDGTNTKSIKLSMNNVNLWQRFDIDETAMIEDGGTTDMTAIQDLGFRLHDRHPNSFGYVDEIYVTPAPGSIELRLWDMGATPPISGSTSLNDGTQYIELGDRGFRGDEILENISLPLIGGKRLYSVQDFIAGPALEIPSNKLLTINNYYALTMHYVDTDVLVYGPNTDYEINYYVHGYAFSTPDTTTGITKLGPYSHCMFGIFSTQDVYVNGVTRIYDATPGNDADEYIFIENKYMAITDIVVGKSRTQQSIIENFEDRYYPLFKGGKFEIYHNDDPFDDTSQLSMVIRYLVAPAHNNNIVIL